MSRFDKYIIERRDEAGKLDLKGHHPAEVFGSGAIEGMTSDQMADIIFRHKPEAELLGDRISEWPKLIDPAWVARRKTW